MPSVQDPRSRPTGTPPERPPPPGCIPRRHHSESPLSHDHQHHHSRNSSNSSTSSQRSSHSARNPRPRPRERQEERSRRPDHARRQSDGAVRRRGNDARDEHRGRRRHEEEQRRYREDMERERRRNHGQRRSSNSQSSRARRGRPEITIVSAQPMFDHPAFADGDKGGYIPPEAPPSYEQAMQTPVPLNPTFTNPNLPDHISEVRRVFPRTQIIHCDAITIPSYSSTVTSQTIQHSNTTVTSSTTSVTSSQISTTNVTSLYVNCSTSATSQSPAPRQRNTNHSNNSQQSRETSDQRQRHTERSTPNTSSRTSSHTNSSKHRQKPVLPTKNPDLLKSSNSTAQQRQKPALPVKNPVLKPKPRTSLASPELTNENNNSNTSDDDSLTPPSGASSFRSENSAKSPTAPSSGEFAAGGSNARRTLNSGNTQSNKFVKNTNSNEKMAAQPPIPASRANKDVMNLFDDNSSSNLPAPLFPGAMNQNAAPNVGKAPTMDYSAFDSLRSNQPQAGDISTPNMQTGTSKYSAFDSLRSPQPQGGSMSTPGAQSSSSDYSAFDSLRSSQPSGGDIPTPNMQTAAANYSAFDSIRLNQDNASQSVFSANSSPFGGSIPQATQQQNVLSANLVGNNPHGGSMMVSPPQANQLSSGAVQPNRPTVAPRNNILQPAQENSSMSPSQLGLFQNKITPAPIPPSSANNVGGLLLSANAPSAVPNVPPQNISLVPPTGKIQGNVPNSIPVNHMQTTVGGQINPKKAVPPPRPTSAPKRNPSVHAAGKPVNVSNMPQGGSAMQGGLLFSANTPQQNNKVSASPNHSIPEGLPHNAASQPLGGAGAPIPQHMDIFSTANPGQSTSQMMAPTQGGTVIPGGIISPTKPPPPTRPADILHAQPQGGLIGSSRHNKGLLSPTGPQQPAATSQIMGDFSATNSNQSTDLMMNGSSLGGAGAAGGLLSPSNATSQNLDPFSADLFSSAPMLNPKMQQNALSGATKATPLVQNTVQVPAEGILPKPVPRKNTPPVVPNLSDTGPNPIIEPVYAAVMHKNKTKPKIGATTPQPQNTQTASSSGGSLLDMFEPSKENLIAAEIGGAPPPVPATRPPLEDLEDLLTPAEMSQALADREKAKKSTQEDIFGFGMPATSQTPSNNDAAMIDPVYESGNFDRGLPHVKQTVAPPMLPAPRKKRGIDKQVSNPDMTSKLPPPLPESRPVMPKGTNAIYTASDGGKKASSPEATLVMREKKDENEKSFKNKLRRTSMRFKQKSKGIFKKQEGTGGEKIENNDKIIKEESPKNTPQQSVAKPARPGPPPRPASLPKKQLSQRQSSVNTEPSLLDLDSPIAQSQPTIAQPAPAVSQASLLDVSTSVVAQPPPAILAELTTAIQEPAATIAQSPLMIVQSQTTSTPVLKPSTNDIQPPSTGQGPPKPARVKPTKPPPPKILPSRPPPARPPPRKNLNQNNRNTTKDGNPNSVTTPSPKPRSNSNSGTTAKISSVGPPARPAPIKPQNKPARPPPAVPPQKRPIRSAPTPKGTEQMKQLPKQTPPQQRSQPKALPRSQMENVTETDGGNTTSLLKAIAIFDFNSGADDELPFKAGDEIKNVSVVDDNWYRGSHGGKLGIFPKGFVAVEAHSDNSTSNAVKVDSPLKTPDAKSVDILSLGNWDDSPQTSNDPVLVSEDTLTPSSNTEDSNQVDPRSETPSSDKFFDASDDLLSENSKESASVTEITREVSTNMVGNSKDVATGDSHKENTPVVANTNDVVTADSHKENTLESPSRTCTAMYAFTGQDDTELTFVEGDVITITGKIDDDWLNGELNGHRGIFPAAYVDQQPQGGEAVSKPAEISTNTSDQTPANNAPSGDSASTPSGGFVEPMATGAQDYTAPSSDEVSFKINDVLYLLEEVDADWLMVQHDQSSAVGKVPKSHVKIVHPLPEGGNSMNWTV